MERLTEWVKQIVFFMIFITFFYQAVPEKKYQRYIRLISGLILILLAVRPLAQFAVWESFPGFSQDLLISPREAEEFRLRAEQIRDLQYEAVREAYRQTVKEQLGMTAERLGLYILRIDVELSDTAEALDQITGIRLTVSSRKPQESEEQAEETGGAGSEKKVEKMMIEPVTVKDRTEGKRAASLKEDQKISELKDQMIRQYGLDPKQVVVDLKE